MTISGDRPAIRVTCVDCPFTKVIEKGDEKPAEVIVEHGQQTGHKLTTEETDTVR